MAKLEMFRYSNQPVELESQQKFQQDWQKYFDKAQEAAGLDMLLLKRYLSFGEYCLIKKHGIKVEIELPKTAKQWATLLDKYQTPIMIAQRADKKGLVLIIKDAMD